VENRKRQLRRRDKKISLDAFPTSISHGGSDYGACAISCARAIRERYRTRLPPFPGYHTDIARETCLYAGRRQKIGTATCKLGVECNRGQLLHSHCALPPPLPPLAGVFPTRAAGRIECYRRAELFNTLIVLRVASSRVSLRMRHA